MKHFFVSLHLDLSDTAPDGPGWYVQVSSDSGIKVDPVSISSDAAQTLSTYIQESLQSTDGEIPNVSLSQLVKSCDALLTDALAEQLAYAEAQAAKISKIRRKLGQIPPKKQS